MKQRILAALFVCGLLFWGAKVGAFVELRETGGGADRWRIDHATDAGVLSDEEAFQIIDIDGGSDVRFNLYLDNGRLGASQFCALDGTSCSTAAQIVAAVTGYSAGAGLSLGGTTFSVNVDDTTIEISGGDQLQVKNGGIDSDQLAADAVVSAKIADDTILFDDLAGGLTLTATEDVGNNLAGGASNVLPTTDAVIGYVGAEIASQAVFENGDTGTQSVQANNGAADASGDYSLAAGTGTADGNYSFAVGDSTLATGLYSIAGGSDTTATGAGSVALGVDGNALSYGEVVLGIYSDNAGYTANSTTAHDSADRLFVIGNGTGAGARGNALVITKDGDATVNGNWDFTGTIQTGADGTDGALVIYSEQGGTDYTYTIQPHAAATDNVVLTLPVDDGTSGQILQTDGSGALSWANQAGADNLGDHTATQDLILGTNDLRGTTGDIDYDNFDVTGASGNTVIGGTLNAGATTLTSTLDVTGATGIDGDFDINTDKFTVNATTGNTVVGGTLNAGATTLTSTLDVTGATGVDGDFDINTDKFTVNATTGNTTVGGTLGVTGDTSITDGTLAVTQDSATTNAVVDVASINASSSGTVDANFGAGLTFDLEDLGGVEEQASIDVVLTDVTDSSEDSKIVLSVREAGSIVEEFTVDGDGITLAAGVSVNEISDDTTLTDSSATALVTENAVKTYVDSQVGALSNNTLDQAYDQGGAGAGRAITVDTGAVQLLGTNAADETLELSRDTATTNAVVDVATIGATSSGAPAAGLGAGLVFEVENDANETEERASIDVSLTTVTDGSEDSQFVFRVQEAGTVGPELTVAGSGISLASGVSVNAILDEDNLASDSDTALATQQSIKAYVDAQTGDNLGNHTATQDINLGGNWIGGDTDADEGIFVATDGSVGIGTDTPSVALEINGALLASGTITSSDRRLKQEIQPLENSLDKIRQIDAYSYTWKDKTRGEGVQFGVIAQELEEVYPDVVHTFEDGYKAVNYQALVAPLIEAVKELSDRVETLEAENQKLQTTILQQK